MARTNQAHWVVLVIMILVGFIFGAIMGEILRPYVPFLAKGASASMSQQTFRLADAFQLTFGFKITLNLATIIGVALAFIIYRKF